MSSIQDFESLAGNYEEAYDSARDFAEQKVQRLTQQADLQGSELLNLVGVGGLSILGKAVTKAGLAGKITQTLDDYQGKMGPIGARAFKIARQVGGDLLGHGKVGEYTSKLGLSDALTGPKPMQPEVEPPSEAPAEPSATAAVDVTLAPAAAAEDDSWKVDIPDELVPGLRNIGQTELAQNIQEAYYNDGVLPKIYLSTAQNALTSSQDAAAQALGQKMIAAKARANLLKGTPAQPAEENSVVAPTVSAVATGTQPVRAPESVSQIEPPATTRRVTTFSQLTSDQAAASRFGPMFQGRVPVTGDEIMPADPIPAPSVPSITEPTMMSPADALGGIFQSGAKMASRMNLPGISSNNIGDAFMAARGKLSAGLGQVADMAKDNAAGLLSTGLGLAAGQLGGKAGQATGLASVGLQSATELAGGELPAGALLMGLNAGLGRLGGVGAKVAQGVNLGAAAGQVGQSFGQAADAVSSLVSAGENAASTISAGLAPATATGTVGETGLLATVGSAIDSVAGEGTTSGVLGTLESLTAGSVAGDEDPLGLLITGGLGLITGLVGAGQGIKDLIEHHRESIQTPSMPSFTAGVVG